jgi:prepilin-type N-terminal cleavage/methylation domain-containing protein
MGLASGIDVVSSMRTGSMQTLQKPRRTSAAAFTLLELLTAVVVVAILATMVVGVVTTLRGKAESGNCASNLRNLYGGVATYMIDKEHWPQISTKNFGKTRYALDWIRALEPYGVTRKSWVCPAIQRASGHPDLYKDDNVRVDYFATPFDTRQNIPWQYPRQPWFIERGAMHGEGNLLIFSNGQVKSLKETVRDTPPAILE